MDKLNIEYWEKRASLGESSGSQDEIAKQIETAAIFKYIKDKMDVLEFGCGNGATAIEAREIFKIAIKGLDYSVKMIKSALANSNGMKDIFFEQGNIMYQPEMGRKFDLVYTQRCLINLPDWDAQKKAIKYLTSLLKPGGRYIMCENSMNGLDGINRLREKVCLPEIKVPWHNCYFDDDSLWVLHWDIEAIIEQRNDFSATYYFLSRVVNAWLAQREGKDPDYNSPINHLAALLPSVGDTAQGKIWVWKKL